MINCSKIVLVATQDNGSKHVSAALNAIERLGATDPILVAWRGSFAFAGYAETNKPSWVTQAQHERYRGPSMMSLVIPLQSHQSGKILLCSLPQMSGDRGNEMRGRTRFKRLPSMDYKLINHAGCW